MLRAVSLPRHATTIKDLATTFRMIVAIEREAFGIDDKPEPNSYEEMLDQALALNEAESAQAG